MTINQEVLEGSWTDIKGKVRHRWGQLTDNELEETRGNVERFVGLIQQKTGEAREEVESYISQAAQERATTLGHAAETVRYGAEQVVGMAGEAAVKAANVARAGYLRTGTMVRRRPLESLSVCFAAGLITGVVVGLLVRSK